MESGFVDRKSELAFLESLGSSNQPKLVLVYGRRRVGKTALLQELAKRKGGLYLLARQESEKDQLKSFSNTMARHFNDETLASSPLQNYDSIFTYLKQNIQPGIPVILDEFPYMVEAQPALPSIMQDHWDNHFQKTRSFFILCGSSMRMMEKLAGYKSPIYGRRTEQLLLGPLTFFDALELMNSSPKEKAVEYYSVVGGTPAYLQLMDYSKTLEQNVVDRLLPKTAFLNQDAMFILREELDEPRNYFSILKSLAKGNTRLGHIINDTGLERGLVAKYLSVLQDLHVVQRAVPIGEKHETRSRKGLYAVSDPYFRFWFAFVFDNAQYTEDLGGQKTFRTRIAPLLDAHVGRIFEEIALEFMKTKTPWGKNYRMGRWWQDEQEIDIAGWDETGSDALLMEVKWSKLDEKKAYAELDRLEKKADAFTKGKPKQPRLKLGIIAKKIEGKERLRKAGFLAYDLDDF